MHCCFLVLVLSLPPVGQQEESWKGKSVFVTTAPIELINGKTDGNGRQTPVAVLDGLRYRVEDEDGDWIQVRQNGVTGWFPKEKAVLADKAVDFFTKEIAASPEDAELYNRRSEVWRYRGQVDRAIADLNEAVRLSPEQRAYYGNRGGAYSAKKNYDQAIQDFGQAIKLDPNYVRAYDSRANLYCAKREFAKAISDFEQAMKLSPNRPVAANDLAWLLATCPDDKFRDGKKAVELATKACELSGWKDGTILDTLAAAYAEAGRFDEAIKWEQEALKDEDAVKQFGDAIRDRIELFKKKQAYRQSPGNG